MITQSIESTKEAGSAKGIKEKTKWIVIIVNVVGTYLLPEIIDKLRTGVITLKAINLKKPSKYDVLIHYTWKD